MTFLANSSDVIVYQLDFAYILSITTKSRESTKLGGKIAFRTDKKNEHVIYLVIRFINEFMTVILSILIANYLSSIIAASCSNAITPHFRVL